MGALTWIIIIAVFGFISSWVSKKFNSAADDVATKYKCRNCGHREPSWGGKPDHNCPECGEYNW